MQVDDLDFRALAENLPTLCWIANPDGFIVWYNRRWYEYTGSTPKEMEGWGWQSVHDPAELPRVLCEWQNSIATGVPFEMIFPLRTVDGGFRPFLTRIVPARDADGAVTAWYGVNTDISEQTIAERELRERKITETRLVQANALAEDARVEAERASVAKSEFLARMSHEIRTPLNAIIGYSDLLLEEYPETPALAGKLEIIQESGAALLAIVNDILDFSKIEAGQVEIAPAAFSVWTLMDNVTSMLATFAARKGIAVSHVIDPKVPLTLLGDESRLRQVILNLANNAIKFSSAGRVSIGVAVKDVGGTAADLRFTVTDGGIGIAAEHLSTLFRRFSQVDGSITRRYGGTGLGLAISKQLVELMGGTIGVDSREGVGSTFWFELTLPVARPAKAIAPVLADMRTSAISILLAEDNEINQDIAKAVLERMGHTVEIASDGARAVAMIECGRYDLILMDVQMPVMDGETATRIIRAATHPNASVPIVAMTANVLPQQIAALKEAGINDHVGKPFKTAALQSVIERWAARGGASLD